MIQRAFHLDIFTSWFDFSGQKFVFQRNFFLSLDWYLRPLSKDICGDDRYEITFVTSAYPRVYEINNNRPNKFEGGDGGEYASWNLIFEVLCDFAGHFKWRYQVLKRYTKLSTARETLAERCPLIARFMGPSWGPSGAGRTQVGHMLAPWTLLSGSNFIVSTVMSSRHWNTFRITGPLCRVPTYFIVFVDSLQTGSAMRKFHRLKVVSVNKLQKNSWAAVDLWRLDAHLTSR